MHNKYSDKYNKIYQEELIKFNKLMAKEYVVKHIGKSGKPIYTIKKNTL